MDGVTPPEGGSGFGRGALRYRRKIFAMFVRGQLVVKLPRSRVDELVVAGHGERFDANKGTPMKEWFSLDPESPCPGRRSRSAGASPGPPARSGTVASLTTPAVSAVSGWLRLPGLRGPDRAALPPPSPVTRSKRPAATGRGTANSR